MKRIITIPTQPEAPEVDPRQISTDFQSTNPTHKVVARTVPIQELYDMIIDPRIQRNRVQAEIDGIYRRFNSAALGVLTESVREDGTRSLVDGQQRREVLMMLHEEGSFDGEVQLLSHSGLTLPEEAQLFLQLNDRKSVDAIRRFKTRLVAEDQQALGIKAILDSLHLGLDSRGVQAITTLDRIYEQEGGPERVEWVLRLLQDVYDNNHRGGCYDGRVIVAFSLVHAAFFDLLDQVRLIDSLASMGDRISKVQGAGKTKKELARRGTIAYHMAEVIRDWYNGTKRDNRRHDMHKPAKLPEFPTKTLESLLEQTQDEAAAVGLQEAKEIEAN